MPCTEGRAKKTWRCTPKKARISQEDWSSSTEKAAALVPAPETCVSVASTGYQAPVSRSGGSILC